MQIQAATITSQGVTFALVVVEKHVIARTYDANDFIESIQYVFPNTPIVLVAQDTRGTPEFYGRKDIREFLETVNLESINFRMYTV